MEWTGQETGSEETEIDIEEERHVIPLDRKSHREKRSNNGKEVTGKHEDGWM